MVEPENNLYEFGPFRLDTTERCLMREGSFVPLTPKAFELLIVLVRNSPRVMGKDELMEELWPDCVVEESNLTQHVFAIRRALGENHSEPRFIETVARRGYRFKERVKQIREVVSEDTKLESQDGFHGKDLISDQKRAKRSWRVAAVVALAVFTIVAAMFAIRARFSDAGEAIDSIAVVPFVTNADPGIEYLADGLTESTIDSLSQVAGLRVVSTNSMSRYKGKPIDPRAIARELGVRAVLTGEITKRDDTLIIRTELIEATRDAHLWGAQYNRRLSEILVVQSDISREIASKLRLKLTGAENRLIKRHTSNPEAYQLYLKGRYFWNKRNEEEVRKGIDYLQQAIDADPLYALAYAGLADCYIVLAAPLNVLPPKDAFSKSKAAATKALEIDETLAEAHASLGVVKQRFEWDIEGAAKEFRRAIELNPTYATAHQWYAINFELQGQPDAAIAETQRALELDPLSIIINARLGHCYYHARRYDEAINQYKKTLELDPNFAIAHSRLGWAYLQKGMPREAVEELLRAKALTGTPPETLASVKQAFARSGMQGYWKKILELEQQNATARYVSAYEIAVLYARLNENEQALKWLDKAYEERSSALVYLKVDPSFEGLRNSPHYIDLLRRINLA